MSVANGMGFAAVNLKAREAPGQKPGTRGHDTEQAFAAIMGKAKAGERTAHAVMHPTRSLQSPNDKTETTTNPAATTSGEADAGFSTDREPVTIELLADTPAAYPATVEEKSLPEPVAAGQPPVAETEVQADAQNGSGIDVSELPVPVKVSVSMEIDRSGPPPTIRPDGPRKVAPVPIMPFSEAAEPAKPQLPRAEMPGVEVRTDTKGKIDDKVEEAAPFEANDAASGLNLTGAAMPALVQPTLPRSAKTDAGPATGPAPEAASGPSTDQAGTGVATGATAPVRLSNERSPAPQSALPQPESASTLPTSAVSAQEPVGPQPEPARAQPEFASSQTTATVRNDLSKLTTAEPAPAAAKPLDSAKPAHGASVHVAPAKTQAQTAPPATFRAELTMAAANYALQAGKATAQQQNREAPPAIAEQVDAAEQPVQPIRVTVLPPRTTQAPPVTIAMPFAVGPREAASPDLAETTSIADPATTARNIGSDDKEPAQPERRATIASAAPVQARSAVFEAAFTPPPAQSAGSTVLAAIASEPTWRGVSVALAQHSAGVGPIAEPRTLSIQLHPAELGMVTATLRLAGDQLTVELAADTHEARRRLSLDSGDIAKALRGLGFDIDTISVLQPQAIATVSSRADDAANASSQFARDQQSAGAGNPGSGGRSTGGQQAERNGNDGASSLRNPGSAAADRGGGGLYI